ncbi:MAG TPA: NADPH-dependent F420 reductase [Burkholderiales bacterium]|nr:NADPH-dependent F420 reductase [Burkholderiales bacterium]
MSAGRPTVALIGGTGDLGTGLAMRWVAAGYPVIIGSREAAKAAEAAARLAPPAGMPAPRSLHNAAAAAAADVVVITVPFASHEAILAEIRESVAGKVVIDATVPLVPPRVARVQLPPEDSAAVAAQRALGEAARVVSAFHNVAALKLQKGEPIDCDVLVFGDRPEDREVAIRLAEAAGLRALHAGPLANSVAAEALTSVLIGINRTYKVEGAGIRITGIRPG